MPKKIFSFQFAAPVLLGLMLTWPFLYPVHAFPITTFYQEWSAALLGFSAGFWMLLKRDFWREARVPRIVLLPLGMAAVVLVQFSVGMLPYFEQALLVLLYFFWAALLVTLGFYLRSRLGLPLLSLILASFLALGAELNAFIGILQHFKWHTFLDPYLTVKLMPQVYGNIAQPNHYANYVTLGLVSLLFLHWKNRVTVVSLGFLALPLLFVLALSGSRSTWIYLIAIAMMSFIFRKRDKQFPQMAIHIAVLMAGLLLVNGLVKFSWLSGGALDTLTPIERMYNAVNGAGSVGGAAYGGSIRLYLWHEAVLMFLHSPFLGVGMGNFTWQHFTMLPTLQSTNITGLYSSAHNLIFQVAAEMGGLGLLVLFGTLLAWVLQARRRQPLSLEAWWGYSLLSVLLIHSLLEYPLWYAHFLGIAALLLGMLDYSSLKLRWPGLVRIPVTIVLVFGLASIQQLYANYKILEYVLAARPSSDKNENYLGRVWYNLAKVQNESVFRPYAEIFMGMTMDAVPAPIADKLALCERIILFSPNGQLVYKDAILLAASGRTIEAKKQIERAIWSYPAQIETFRQQLIVLNQVDPRHFAGLPEYADGIYRQYQKRL